MAKKLRNDNYIVIQGWMVSELGLKGNELLVYACIYGFSQAENQAFNGGLQYLADWTNGTKQGVIKSLKSLTEKGFIGKRENIINGVKFVEYYVTEFNGVLNSGEQGIKLSLPNNKYKNNINNNIKYTYGQEGNILLTNDEFEKLKQRFPDDYQERIDNMSIGIAIHGYKYKSHYLAILNWARNEKANNGRNKPTAKSSEQKRTTATSEEFNDIQKFIASMTADNGG